MPGVAAVKENPMRTYRFQVVNVFAESTFGGNPLAVFEDARGLSDEEQQMLTDQFNLSETTFIWPASEGSSCAAKVRIFSPGYEMNFAGHPTLGTSFVVSELLKAGERFSLELKVGPIEVSTIGGGRWSLRSAEPAWSEVTDVPGVEGVLPGPVAVVHRRHGNAGHGCGVHIADLSCNQRGDNIALIIGNAARFLEVNAKAHKIVRDKPQVLVLGAPGQDFIANQ